MSKDAPDEDAGVEAVSFDKEGTAVDGGIFVSSKRRLQSGSMELELALSSLFP